MDSGSGLDTATDKGKESGNGERKFGAFFKRVEPFLPKKDWNPRDLRSWAKKTGFVSGETSTSTTRTKFGERIEPDLQKSRDQSVPESSHKAEIDPILGRTTPKKGSDVEELTGSEVRPVQRNELGEGRDGNSAATAVAEVETDNGGGKIIRDLENGVYYYPGGGESADGEWPKAIVLKYGLRDNTGFVPLIYYGLQHYLSLAGSLVMIPLVIVPAMNGSDKDTAAVISTMLLLTGVTTILHCYFGTRLPLVQGSSFVYLAPALVVINSKEFRNLTEHVKSLLLTGIWYLFWNFCDEFNLHSLQKFQDIMKELQGAIIIGSLFQIILGFSGLMSLLLRFINPVVVAPTVAAVGLAFFSYGFPQAGTCVEISIPFILLVLIFTLYLRGVSLFGHRLFRIYAVPLSGLIIWAYAFFLTIGGGYNYNGCNDGIPSSNILKDECKRHVYTMKHCRTDASNAWRTASWIRIPYPFQWGLPNFHIKTSIIMIFVSLIASVDSVGTYHSAAMLVNSKCPTRGIVSRGIGLEGFCSLLAGIWGSGTGCTTLTENIHTINITKVASRKAMVIGALFLIVFSFVGKVGAVLASIPQALAASVLCFVWALTVALGLSSLRYTQSSSFRNITIVGVSLFLGLSVPAYVQTYQPLSTLILPSYYLSFGAASSGPVYTGVEQVDFAMNAVMSLNMVMTFLLAFVLDNTVPGSKEERGVYAWSRAEDLAIDTEMQADYLLPRRVAQFFGCRCLGC